MPFLYLAVLSEMIATILKPLLSFEWMIVKDTQLLKLKVRKGRKWSEQPPVRGSPQTSPKTENVEF